MNDEIPTLAEAVKIALTHRSEVLVGAPRTLLKNRAKAIGERIEREFLYPFSVGELSTSEINRLCTALEQEEFSAIEDTMDGSLP